jgi:hypothetical protein
MNLATQLKEQAAHTEETLRAAASMCEADAESGIFHDEGLRCGFCLHALEGGGCRLRLLATAAQAA